MVRGRHAQHGLDVLVRERVVGVERERALEGPHRLGPDRRLVHAGSVVKPGLTQPVPGVGVAWHRGR